MEEVFRGAGSSAWFAHLGLHTTPPDWDGGGAQ